MRLVALVFAVFFSGLCFSQTPYSKRAEVRTFIKEMAEQHGFVERELQFMFSRVKRADPVLQAIVPQPPAVRSWDDYRGMFVNDKRIAGGSAFWQANRAALARAEKAYGVPAEYIVSIIGVETFYGRNTGKWRVVDALTTLAFDYPPRAAFFRDELASYLLLARDSGFDVFSLRGSYAGAIGIPQFIPSSVRRYAIDFDGNGAVDLRGSPTDAVGSVANFLKEHGWVAGAPVLFASGVSGDGFRPYADGTVDPKHRIAELAAAGVDVKAVPQGAHDQGATLIELPTPGKAPEYRVGLKNFWVLTRYNRSAFYASAVTDLAAELKKAQEAGR
jgi:membrane-bound lytic murein transglycosylase B